MRATGKTRKARKPRKSKNAKPPRRWKRWVVLGIFVAIAGACFLKSVRGALELWTRQQVQPNPSGYVKLTEDLERSRSTLAARYLQAKTAQDKKAVEQQAREVLENQLPQMMRCWLGTPWDFKGTAERPGGGKIACGYFVSTVLKDAGFQVDRYKLAQQPSGNILQTFLLKDECELSIGKEFSRFQNEIHAHASGIYLVGLDTHIGFLLVKNGQFEFIHASGSLPWCVVETPLAQTQVVARSKWRMLGNLTLSPQAIRLWLKGEKIAVKAA